MEPPDFDLPGHRIRVGCDVVAVGEIENSLASFDDRFLTRIYTPGEVATCTGPDRVARLAARFAAKEAAIKAFGRPDAAFVPLEIELVISDRLPTLRLTGSAAQLAAEQQWQEVSVSITHTDCHAAAVVVAVCAE
ncbi:holo-ACP synthase [Mycolicibacterium fortuitum]|uniref:Holo-[acyl-carrier-protein] synthase n=2 Tax=Mycolicibacterium fortuitum TaxID=1766 RepID=A0AAE5ACF2_MYCFO|nr:4'-phosphopantetheinyl transferase superfamily protein [Mycolicibacterium fortuitum]MCV7140646.1 4'-phosphopantetheinyl transferase superfamily protein [Mycolicibacterium fortuitum]MDV7191965.1 4'-phosphopantetheinyl transferase superfamily protein [Mycolicibacterium fortuitum]MDV7203607.1 4'-phosphopantetheinyl transferase superfamily protein [Mycolicibacterium fortuitum]MDV7226075.1 4'-phosphopantetheinyl transferase superfamily protein [Mycolicibacterium fortuitum]MDV7258564.1 4'-phospho